MLNQCDSCKKKYDYRDMVFMKEFDATKDSLLSFCKSCFIGEKTNCQMCRKFKSAYMCENKDWCYVCYICKCSCCF